MNDHQAHRGLAAVTCKHFVFALHAHEVEEFKGKAGCLSRGS